MHRQAIARGRVAYEPNSLGGGCPFQAGAEGFVSFPQPLEGDHVRGKPERFAEHYQQATLFWESQSAPEQQHIIRAFRFELSKVQIPAIRKRVVAQLRNVAAALAQGVADGLGMAELPDPMPLVFKKSLKPEVTRSTTLSLLSRPGVDGIKTRRVAIVLSDGANTEVAAQLHAGLVAQGAVPKFLGVKLGTIEGASRTLDIEASLEILPSVLWDGVVMLDGPWFSLCESGQAVEFLKDQYRHCKPILIFNGAKALLEKLGLPDSPSNGAVQGDPGLLAFDEDVWETALSAFGSALAQHRNFERETDPPRV
jgi:catalase